MSTRDYPRVCGGTRDSRRWAGVRQDCPRVCGGTQDGRDAKVQGKGLSPRVRGNPSAILRAVLRWCGTIPACGGAGATCQASGTILHRAHDPPVSAWWDGRIVRGAAGLVPARTGLGISPRVRSLPGFMQRGVRSPRVRGNFRILAASAFRIDLSTPAIGSDVQSFNHAWRGRSHCHIFSKVSSASSLLLFISHQALQVVSPEKRASPWLWCTRFFPNGAQSRQIATKRADNRPRGCPQIASIIGTSCAGLQFANRGIVFREPTRSTR